MTIAAEPVVLRSMFTAGDAPTPRTLLDIVRASAEQHPNALAVDDGTTALTYRALITEVLELKEKLAADGVGVGDRVGIRVPSGTVDLYVSILATLATGT